ncbi:protocadherin gamma-A8-like [Meleagris gallopavo]|uniref:protocadherin gamma-A8-like n=1 Tax=Meleagris gallopavo TaxID=9103 RepID=UPI0012ABB214|nr:protocadherin gamma-A8-like [Meleagris gallopavo]
MMMRKKMMMKDKQEDLKKTVLEGIETGKHQDDYIRDYILPWFFIKYELLVAIVPFSMHFCANVNRATANNDHTVVSLACAGGHLAVVELLLAHGADPTHRLKDGSTMLIEAAKGGHTNVVSYLLDYPNNVLPVPSADLSQLTPPSQDQTQVPRVPVHTLAMVVPPQEPDRTPQENSPPLVGVVKGGGAARAVRSVRLAGGGGEGAREVAEEKSEVGAAIVRWRRCCGGGGAVREMCAAREGRCGRRQRALLCCVLVAVWEAAWGQLRYSVPEELPKGSFVGDVAEDLALELAALGGRGARVVSQGRTQYFALHASSGHLVTAERIDREQLCESEPQCVLRCELIVEGEMKVYAIEVEITDVNDNAPSFKNLDIEEEISEITVPGTRFPLPEAHDLDVGMNSLQSYALSGDEHFSLSVQAGADGEKRPELVLAKALDREEAAFHELLLRASDGGEPARTGTARIRVAVLDANDNAPAFSQAVYTVRVPEDVPVGSTLLSVTATDPDEGTNGEVKYNLRKMTKKASKYSN